MTGMICRARAVARSRQLSTGWGQVVVSAVAGARLSHRHAGPKSVTVTGSHTSRLRADKANGAVAGSQLCCAVGYKNKDMKNTHVNIHVHI